MLDERSTIFPRRLLRWYDANRRDLPWRAPLGARVDRRRADASGALDPYRVLVSEAMLQQTQVATVVPYFHRFITRFPTLADLAAADEQDVLRTWQGLGYYSRARNLLAAARMVAGEFGGRIPGTVDELLRLPGVGRYTAGAVASIAFGQRAAVLDGNVTRVLCRLDGIKSDPRDRAIQQRLWQRAQELVPKSRPGDFNSAMMELGATVCTPRNPKCQACPVSRHCRALAGGLQDRIPPPRRARSLPVVRRVTICLRRRRDGRWLIEQRPAAGRWAGMWQFVTIEPRGKTTDAALTAASVREALAVCASRPRRIGRLTHVLTHRRYEFDVFECHTNDGRLALRGTRKRAWVRLEELSEYPLPKPQVAIGRLLTDGAASPRADGSSSRNEFVARVRGTS